MNLHGDTLQAAYYCAAREIRRRQLAGQPVPPSVRKLFDRLDIEIRVSPAGQESAGDERQSTDELMSTQEAAGMLRLSPRQVRRIQADLDGRTVAGRLAFPRSSVTQYAEGRHG